MKKNTSFKVMLATISLLGIVPVTVNTFVNQSGVFFVKTSLEDLFTEKTIKEQDANDGKIVNDAIESTLFTKSAILNSKATDLISSVNANYIKSRLSKEIVNIFDESLFKLNKITNGFDWEISDFDLEVKGPVLATIFYDYGSYTNQSTRLRLWVEEISRSTERDTLLEQIKIKADKDEDDNEWTYLWFNYFKQIEKDVKDFWFMFPWQDLKKHEILQNIIYDEIKLVMETDFKFWGIEKGYDPTSVEVQYTKFEINDDSENDEFYAEGKVSIDIKSFGKFVRHSIVFNYVANYGIIF